MKSEIRVQRVESALHNAIVQALVRLDIDNCIVTRVSISRDMRNAAIYYIMENKENDCESLLKLLQINQKSITKEVMKIYHGRVFPKISFCFDKGFRASERINALLDNLPEASSENL